jgi:hypothetical protein
MGTTVGFSCLSFIQRELEGASGLAAILNMKAKFKFRCDNRFISGIFLRRMHQTSLKSVPPLRKYRIKSLGVDFTSPARKQCNGKTVGS